MTDASKGGSSIEVFISYSHKDEKLRGQLDEHLANLKRQGLISAWHDRQIPPGSEWGEDIDTHLNAAKLILLLISPSFMASDYCNGVEVERAMQRHASSEASVIPVILRPVDWTNAPFSKLQALPKDAKPVTEWTNRDRAFRVVVEGIRTVLAAMTSPAREIKIRAAEPTRIESGAILTEKVDPSPPATQTSFSIDFRLGSRDGLRLIIFSLKKAVLGNEVNWTIDFQLLERQRATDPFGTVIALNVKVDKALNSQAQKAARDGLSERQTSYVLGPVANDAKAAAAGKVNPRRAERSVQDTLKK